MRRIVTGRWRAAVLLAAVCVAVAGCGKSGGNAKLPAALEQAMRYLPKDAEVTAVVPTNLHSGPLKQLDQLGAKLRGWERLKQKVSDSLARDGVNFKQELRAIAGNPIAFAIAPNGDDQFIAIVPQDPAAFRKQVERDIASGKNSRLPEYKGAFAFKDNDSDSDLNYNGLRDGVLFAADSEQLLHKAIDASGGSDNLASNDELKSELSDLGEDSLLRVVGDAQKLIDAGDPTSAANARKVGWVDALGDFTVKARTGASGVDVAFTLKTDRKDLSSNDLPLASGSETPPLHDASAPAAIALRNPDQVVLFAESVGKQLNSAGYSQYQGGLNQLKGSLGVDLHKDLLGQIESVSVAFAPGPRVTFVARLKDAAKFSTSLRGAQSFLQQALSGSNLTLGTRGGDYVVKRGGKEIARFATKGGSLIGSVLSASLPAPTGGSPIPGAQGALALEADIAKVARFVEQRTSVDPLARDILASLGGATISVEAETGELTGKAHLEVSGSG